MVLTAAVVVLTVLVLVDLLLSAAIIRRLRDTEAQLADALPSTQPGLRTGTPMPDFSSADGSLTRADVAGTPVLLGFFSTGCRYCPAQAEQLAHRASEIAGQGIRVVNVLTVVDEDMPDDLTPVLEKSGTVVTEHGPGGLMAAFSVSGTPTFLLYDGNGTLLGNGHTIDAALERWIP
jgi:thioredoxin-related protein